MRTFLTILILIVAYLNVDAQNSSLSVVASMESGCAPLNTHLKVEGEVEKVEWILSDGRILAGNDAEVKLSHPGIYWVSVKVYNGQGEQIIENVQVLEVFPSPQPEFLINLKENTAVTLPTIGSQYAWFLKDGTVLNNSAYEIELLALEPGEYDIAMEETNWQGCVSRTDYTSVMIAKR